MKYICLGYLEPGKFDGMTEAERHAVLDECVEHTMTICVPTDILSPKYLFSLRSPTERPHPCIKSRLTTTQPRHPTELRLGNPSGLPSEVSAIRKLSRNGLCEVDAANRGRLGYRRQLGGFIRRTRRRNLSVEYVG